MGGVPPYGYRVEIRKLVVDKDATAHVRLIFARSLEIGFCAELAREIGTRGNRIDIDTDGLNVGLRVDGLSCLAREMLAGGVGEAA